MKKTKQSKSNEPLRLNKLNKLKLHKKAQITLFIILGILLLFSSAVYIYFKVLPEQQNIISTQKGPIQQFVESCLDTTTQDALYILGNQAGYITIPDKISNNPGSYLSFDKNGLSKIPYWYYHGLIRVPDVNFMEGEISNYVKNNIKGCIRNFSSFNQFDITIKGNLSVETRINDKSVVVNLIYPFDAYDFREGKQSYEKFPISSDVKLKRMIDLANEVFNYEIENAFLENITIDLMALHDDIPFSGFEFSCSKNRWYLSDIKKTVQDTVYENFIAIRFKNTNYPAFLYPENQYGKNGLEDSYEYFNLFVKPSTNDYKDLKAGIVYYPDFGMDINARPSYRGVLESDRGKGKDLLKYLCINTYHFTYDVYFPSLFVVSDNEAFHNKGYTFRFAMPVTIDHNTAAKKVVAFEQVLPPVKFDAEFCNERTKQEFEIAALGTDGFYFGIELKNVNVTFKCINYECPLGQTKNTDGRFMLRTTVPSSCSVGSVILEKEGYLPKEARLTQNKIDVELTKLKSLNLKFRKQKEDKFGTNLELDEDEFVSYTLTANGFDYEETGIYRPGEQRKINLIYDDATYYLDAMLFKDQKMIGGFKGNITITLDELSSANEVLFRVVNYHLVPILDSEKYSLFEYLDSDKYQNNLQPLLN